MKHSNNQSNANKNDIHEKSNLLTNITTNVDDDIKMHVNQPQHSDNPITQSNIQHQIHFSLNAFCLSLNMLQKLKDNLPQLQSILAETLKSNNKLYKETSELIFDTLNKIKEESHQYQQEQGFHPLNLFSFWSDSNPIAAKVLRSFQNAVPYGTKNGLAKEYPDKFNHKF